MRGSHFTLRQVNDRPVPTRCKEAGGRSGVSLGGLAEEPGAPDKRDTDPSGSTDADKVRANYQAEVTISGGATGHPHQVVCPPLHLVRSGGAAEPSAAPGGR